MPRPISSILAHTALLSMAAVAVLGRENSADFASAPDDLEGDPLDWVNVEYVVQQAKVSTSGRTSTTDAKAAIIRGAAITAKRGPWSMPIVSLHETFSHVTHRRHQLRRRPATKWRYP